eukprot:3759375-Lingulodinium_polyedra.AAC.1
MRQRGRRGVGCAKDQQCAAIGVQDVPAMEPGGSLRRAFELLDADDAPHPAAVGVRAFRVPR